MKRSPKRVRVRLLEVANERPDGGRDALRRRLRSDVTDAVQLHEAAVGHSVVQRVDPVTRVVAVSPPATPRGSGVRVGRVASGAWLARAILYC